jgi:hypothetical protein
MLQPKRRMVLRLHIWFFLALTLVALLFYQDILDRTSWFKEVPSVLLVFSFLLLPNIDKDRRIRLKHIGFVVAGIGVLGLLTALYSMGAIAGYLFSFLINVYLACLVLATYVWVLFSLIRKDTEELAIDGKGRERTRIAQQGTDNKMMGS